MSNARAVCAVCKAIITLACIDTLASRWQAFPTGTAVEYVKHGGHLHKMQRSVLRPFSVSRRLSKHAVPVRLPRFDHKMRFHAMHQRAVKSTLQDPPFTIHIGETTVEVPFSPSAALSLRESFGGLLKTFADKQKALRPQRWDIMEYRYQGSADGPGLASFEVACNPNAYPTAFDAKLMVTIRTKDGVKVTTEGRLSNFKADFEAYLRDRKAEQAAGAV